MERRVTLTLCILGSIICLALLIIAVCKILQVRKERRERMAVAYIGPGIPLDPEPHELVPIERYWN
jgi:hypothetical protein